MNAGVLYVAKARWRAKPRRCRRLGPWGGRYLLLSESGRPALALSRCGGGGRAVFSSGARRIREARRRLGGDRPGRGHW